MTAVEKAKEDKVYNKIMNVIDDFVKHGERIDLSSETRCVAYINKGKLTRWLKQNFAIRELASLEAEKPADDAIDVAEQIYISFGDNETDEAIEILNKYAESYHQKQCVKCQKVVYCELCGDPISVGVCCNCVPEKLDFTCFETRSDITTDVDS